MGAPRPYVDKYGHPHTAAVFDHWHPRIIAFMDIRRTKRTPYDVAEDRAADARVRLRERARTV